MIIYQAEANQTNHDIPGMLALAICSICLKTNFEVKVKEGWKEPLNLYTAIQSESFPRRSSFFSDMLEPIADYEKEWIDKIRPLIKERDMLESKISFYNNQYAKNGNLEHLKKTKRLDEQIRDLSGIHPPVLMVDSVTPEALVHIMYKNNGQLSIISDNGDLFDFLKNEKYMRIFLKAYNQDPIYFNHRLSKVQTQINNPNMSICLSTLTSKIHDLTTLPFGDRLISCFLISYPEEKLAKRQCWIPEDLLNCSDVTTLSFRNC